jgi:hypothetical protein
LNAVDRRGLAVGGHHRALDARGRHELKADADAHFLSGREREDAGLVFHERARVEDR